MNYKLSKETFSQKQRWHKSIREHLSHETQEQRPHRLSLIHKRLLNETPDERSHRLNLKHVSLANEYNKERSRQLTTMKKHERERLQNERADEHLQIIREIFSDMRHSFNEEAFVKAIHSFADKPCTICKKTSYPQQMMQS